MAACACCCWCREIVEQLQALGVPTRALVRDVYKAVGAWQLLLLHSGWL